VRANPAQVGVRDAGVEKLPTMAARAASASRAVSGAVRMIDRDRDGGAVAARAVPARRPGIRTYWTPRSSLLGLPSSSNSAGTRRSPRERQMPVEPEQALELLAHPLLVAELDQASPTGRRRREGWL
jgi:hypothetical protein